MRESGFELLSVPLLESPRLIYRGLEEADVDRYFELCKKPEMMKSYGLPPHPDREASAHTIATLARWFENGRSIRWALSPKEDPERIVGDIGFWQFDLIRDRGEMGAKIDPAWAGSGLGREALSRILRFGFEALDLKGIDANISPQNGPSLHLAEKLGFHRVGIRPALSFSLLEERWSDMVFLSLNRSDWVPSRDAS